MIFIKRCGLVLAATALSINTWATELNTDEQKLGYIIGMDIGKSLRAQGTEIDLDTLIEAIRATYLDQELAMSAEEAVLQMEMLGHEFFFFLDAGLGRHCVVYRRRDGNVGLIEPE